MGKKVDYRRSSKESVKSIVIVYLMSGYSWIIVTDGLVGSFLSHDFHIYESIKGLLYVSITAILLYLLLNKYLIQIITAHDKAVENELRFREIYELANDGIAVFSLCEQLKDIRFIESNEIFHRITGYTSTELVNMSIGVYIPDSSDFIRKIIDNGSIIEEITIIMKDGRSLPVEVNSKIFIRNQRRVLVSVFRDIRERKQTEQKIRHLAYFDSMTNLPNAHYFYDRLNELLHRSRPFSVIVVQINRFNEIQDAFGRTRSIELHQRLAERLQSVVSQDELFSRIDSHTFKMLVLHCVKEDLEVFLTTLEQKMKESYRIGDDEVSMEIHTGVACYPRDGDNSDALLQNAYYNLSQAKYKGTVFFLNGGKREGVSKRKLLLENDLKKALALKELQVHFQPKVKLGTNEVIGIEALARWNHGKLGMISPAEFIPIAEESGNIISLGKWLLYESCRVAKQLQNDYSIYIHVSVNVSVKQFWQSNIDETVLEALNSTGLDSHYLVLEITESMTMNQETTLEILTRLKEIGVQISIDDFGTGFSSLAYLKKYPVDELKIDKTFIDDILNNENDQKIVQAIISMAHHLNMSVVAEGVEHQQQKDLLFDLQCDAIQGYLESPPKDYRALVKYLKPEY
jgi:diguanylate cyclase (GGDEF)-like protein/PAS domain S-box-containing protein